VMGVSAVPSAVNVPLTRRLLLALPNFTMDPGRTVKVIPSLTVTSHVIKCTVPAIQVSLVVSVPQC